MVCASISSGLFTAALPFLKQASLETEQFQKLNCLGCEPPECYDNSLKKRLEMDSQAALWNLSRNSNRAVDSRLFFHHVGLTLSEMRSAGLNPPESFVTTIIKILESEVARKIQIKEDLPSVSPWDAMVCGSIPPDLVLTFKRCASVRESAQTFTPGPPDGNRRQISHCRHFGNFRQTWDTMRPLIS
jgi:hypothetical protein